MSVTLNGFEMSGTTTNRPDNIEAGQPYYNTTDAEQQVWDGSNWLTVITTASSGTVAAATIVQLTSTVITVNAISGGSTPMTITGKSQATTVAGGSVVIAGAASIAGATGAGGAASLAGGASGATDAAGGAASVAGGLGTGTGDGGAASLTSGAASGTTGGASGDVAIASGTAASHTTGAAGDSGDLTISTGAAGIATTGDAGASGAIGITTAVGGATSGAAGDGGDAGAITLTAGNGGADAEGGSGTGGIGGTIALVVGDGGAGATAGIAGIIRLDATTIARKQGAPATVTTAATLTATQMLSGIITGSDSDGSTVALQLPTGTAMDAALPVDFGADDAFEIVIINASAAAADTYTLTENTGTGDFTIVGNPIMAAAHSSSLGSGSATFRCRKTAANTLVAYRV